MSGAELFFLVVGAVAVASALAVILSSNTVHGGLFLLLNLFSLAVLYLTVGADFLFAVQIIIYAGAILVLFMFVITLLNPVSEGELMGLRGRAVPAVVLCGALLLEAGLMLRVAELPPGRAGQPAGIVEIGEALFTRYLLPFEVVSLLLLVAVVGAIVLAKRRDSPEEAQSREAEDEAATPVYEVAQR